ncbi:DUF1549 and DUF1553 domain-containing protein [bacterium]|nr:DUF1549 and DUF1553 domain-containing protein [bacterium]
MSYQAVRAISLMSVFLSLYMCQSVSAGDVPGPDSKISEVIDYYVGGKLQSESIVAARLIDDLAFLRRLSLDLAGRVPTVQEQADYMALPESERREKLVELLVSQSDFAFHQANEIDLLLLARLKKDNDWREFLLQAAKENRSWETIFKQVMTPEVECPDQVGPAAFLRERIRELDDLTNDTAILFFGVNISCAKCHDHPLVADWEQDHYFGMSSFFKRTYQTKARMVAEDFQGDVKFTNILGEEIQAEFMFLSNVSVSEEKIELAEDERKKLEEAVKQAKNDEKVSAPEVSFSPRTKFVDLALSQDKQNFFARNIVNRTWARLIGYGLVMPLDQMHSDNPASHPELMDWLVNDLKTHNYDLKRLISGIVISETYARSCRWISEDELPTPSLFATGTVRPLNPRQLALSLIIATSNSERLPGFEKPDDWEKQRTDFENRSSGFADLFPIPDVGFQVGTDEALLFSNSDRFANEFLRTSDDRLIGELKKIESSEIAVEKVYQSIFCREPTEVEKQALLQYLDRDQESKETVLQQVVWALLASPEFRFNH